MPSGNIPFDPPLTTCICTPRTNAYSETFIREHINRLPGRVLTLYGNLPFVKCAEREVIPLPLRVVGTRMVEHIPGSQPLQNFAQRLVPGRIAGWLRREKVDVVLAEYGVTAVTYIDACRLARVPLVVHFHGYDASQRDVLQRYEAEYRKLFRDAAAMVVVSTEMRDRVAQLAGSPERIHYNPYGVDLSRFRPADPSKNPPVFVAVGRFVEKKAPHLTILAFREVLRSCPDARLIMGGDGRLLDTCKELVQALDIEGCVEFQGPLTHDQVVTLMQGARAFVQHSVTAPSGDAEGTPVTILEAGASALPVVATLHAGIRDTMIDGQTAFLVREFDVHAMAAAMLRLAKCPELACRLGQGARRRVEEQFSVDRSIQGLADILSAAARQFEAHP